MGTIHIAANHAKKQLYILGKRLCFSAYYVDTYLLGHELEEHNYPKDYETLFNYVRGVHQTIPDSEVVDIARALTGMGIDIVLSDGGAGVYDSYDEMYLDYTYIGSVYKNDTDVGKTQREVNEED